MMPWKLKRRKELSDVFCKHKNCFVVALATASLDVTYFDDDYSLDYNVMINKFVSIIPYEMLFFIVGSWLGRKSEV